MPKVLRQNSVLARPVLFWIGFVKREGLLKPSNLMKRTKTSGMHETRYLRTFSGKAIRKRRIKELRKDVLIFSAALYVTVKQDNCESCHALLISNGGNEAIAHARFIFQVFQKKVYLIDLSSTFRLFRRLL